MFKFLSPDLFMADILAIKPEILKDLGIKGIICDLDNTIIPWNEDILEEEIINWFLEIKASGFKVCLVSNSLHKRVNGIAQVLKVDAIPAAVKPFKGAFIRALDMLQLSPDEIVVIGDQIFTDIFGGKRLGLKTILVKPLSKEELFWTRFIRFIEEKLLKRE